MRRPRKPSTMASTLPPALPLPSDSKVRIGHVHLKVADLERSLGFYREAGKSCTRLLDQCAANKWQRLLLCGVSDLAEIATLRAMEREFTIVGFYDPACERLTFLGKPVWRDLQNADPHEARILTEIASPQTRRTGIVQADASVPLLVPDVLRLKP